MVVHRLQRGSLVLVTSRRRLTALEDAQTISLLPSATIGPARHTRNRDDYEETMMHDQAPAEAGQ